MKSTGIVRKVDELGRIVLPIELRRTLDIGEKEALEIYVDEDQIIEFVLNKKSVLFLPDQDVITALYGDKVKIIDTMKYNLSDRMLYLHNSDIRNKKIDL